MIRFTCPECAEVSRISEDLRGMDITCQHCRVSVPVPRWHALESERDAPMESSPFRLPEEAPASPLRQKLVFFGTCAAISLAAIALSYALAGNGFLRAATYIALIFVGVVVAGFFLGMLRGLLEGTLREGVGLGMLLLAGWVAYLGGTLGACLLVHNNFAVAGVHVDNYTGRPVKLFIGGKEWASVGSNRSREEALRMGTYAVEVQSEAGEVLDRMTVNVADAGPYILNVLGKQVYARGTREYSSFSLPFGGGQPPEQRVNARWFKADVDYLFTTPPGSISVSVRKGQGYASASRTYLRRGEPTKRD